MNVGVHVSFTAWLLSLGIPSTLELLCPVLVLFFVLENLRTVLRGDCANSHSCQVFKDPFSPHSCQHVSSVVFAKMAILTDVRCWSVPGAGSRGWCQAIRVSVRGAQRARTVAVLWWAREASPEARAEARGWGRGPGWWRGLSPVSSGWRTGAPVPCCALGPGLGPLGVQHWAPGQLWARGSLGSLSKVPWGGHGYPLQYSCQRIPWTVEPGGLQSMGSQSVGQDSATRRQSAGQWGCVPAPLAVWLKCPSIGAYRLVGRGRAASRG